MKKHAFQKKQHITSILLSQHTAPNFKRGIFSWAVNKLLMRSIVSEKVSNIARKYEKYEKYEKYSKSNNNV